jgi:hypothetical protein
MKRALQNNSSSRAKRIRRTPENTKDELVKLFERRLNEIPTLENYTKGIKEHGYAFRKTCENICESFNEDYTSMSEEYKLYFIKQFYQYKLFERSGFGYGLLIEESKNFNEVWNYMNITCFSIESLLNNKLFQNSINSISHGITFFKLNITHSTIKLEKKVISHLSKILPNITHISFNCNVDFDITKYFKKLEFIYIFQSDKAYKLIFKKIHGEWHHYQNTGHATKGRLIISSEYVNNNALSGIPTALNSSITKVIFIKHMFNYKFSNLLRYINNIADNEHRFISVPVTCFETEYDADIDYMKYFGNVYFQPIYDSSNINSELQKLLDMIDRRRFSYHLTNNSIIPLFKDIFLTLALVYRRIMGCTLPPTMCEVLYSVLYPIMILQLNNFQFPEEFN